MIIIDKALAERAAQNKPIRVGMIGAGFMARGIALQICKSVPGMQLVAIANRNITAAERAYHEAEAFNVEEVHTVLQLEENIQAAVCSVTENPFLLCKAKGIDAIIEVTGAVEYGAKVVMSAIENKKHVILMNAELDGTVGPILKVYADKAGVIYTNVDGDQPGVQMNLYRFVKSIGVKPVLIGNIKGLHDPYRNPTTQAGFAAQWGQKPEMVTSFADGSKISFEQAIVANGTGMGVAKRGMLGPRATPGTPLKEAVALYDVDVLLKSDAGLVDYVVGAEPGPGVFVLGTHDDPRQQHYLNLYKLGAGPLYLFYTPYHLCHFEVPLTVARAVLFNDAALAPQGGPVVEVVATAKIDLNVGETLDGIGGFMSYGLCENAGLSITENLLPLGVAEGCILKRPVKKDAVLTYDDVVLPEGRTIDRLREAQHDFFKIEAEVSS